MRCLLFFLCVGLSLSSWASRVDTLVLINANNPDSEIVGAYYADERGVPDSHILRMHVATTAFIDWPAFVLLRDQVIHKLREIIQSENTGLDLVACIEDSSTEIDTPLYCQASLDQIHSFSRINYLVTTKGVPYRLRLNSQFPSEASSYSSNDNQPTSVDNILIAMLSTYGVNFVPNMSLTAEVLDDEFFIGRIDGHSNAMAKDMVDRAKEAEAAGVYGKLMTNDVVSFSEYNPIDSTKKYRYQFGLFDETSEECTGNGGSFYNDSGETYSDAQYVIPLGEHLAPINCNVQLNTGSHLGGWQTLGHADSRIPMPTDALIYFGHLDDQQTAGGLRRFKEFLNWRKDGPQVCDNYLNSVLPRCDDLPGDQKEACFNASTDVYGEIDTRCAGVAEGFIGYNYQSFPVSIFSGMPTGWDLRKSNDPNGLLLPVVNEVQGNGHKGAGESSDNFSLRYINDYLSTALCYNNSQELIDEDPPASQCPNIDKRVLLDHPELQILGHTGEIDYEIPVILLFWIKGDPDNLPGGELRITSNYQVNKPKWPAFKEGGDDVDFIKVEIPAGEGADTWQLIVKPLTLTRGNSEFYKKFGMKVTLRDPNGKIKEFSLDDVSLIVLEDQDGTPVSYDLYSNGSFDKGMQATSHGAWAFDFLNRYRGVAFWGSTSHYQTFGYSFKGTEGDLLRGFLRGDFLGKAVWGTQTRVSGIFYGDPLYSPLAIRLDINTENQWSFTDDSPLILEGAALNGTDDTASVSYKVFYCPGDDFYYCDINESWQETSGVEGTIKGREDVNFGEWDWDSSSVQPGRYILKLSVTSSNNGKTQVYNDFQVVTIYDEDSDYDGDGVPDSYELSQGLNPELEFVDTDEDGMHDEWEHYYELTVGENDALGHKDDDGHINLLEYLRGSKPNDETSVPELVEYEVKSLEEFITANDEADHGDTIVLAAGNYDFTEDIVITRSINLEGPVNRGAVISGKFSWNFQVLAASVNQYFHIPTSISGLTFNNIALKPPFSIGYVNNVYGDTFKNCHFNIGTDIHFQGENINFSNCTFNTVSSNKKIFLHTSEAAFNNVTIAGFDTAITLISGDLYITNSIFDNVADFYNLGEGLVDIAYSNVSNSIDVGDFEATGNISVDPLFIDSQLHLRSDSQAIDAGDTAASFDDEPDITSGGLNMGAYGNTSEAASKSGAVLKYSTGDWTINDVAGVMTSVGDDNSLTINFEDPGDINYSHNHSVIKGIDVDPKLRYRVSAKIKVIGITSARGVRLEVMDKRPWSETEWLRKTKEYFDTNGAWAPVTIEFQPYDKDSEQVRIYLRRVSGGGEVTGTVSIKDVAFEVLGPPSVSFSNDNWGFDFIEDVEVNLHEDPISIEFSEDIDPNYFHTYINNISIDPTHSYRLSGKLKATDITSGNSVFLQAQDVRGWGVTKWAKKTGGVSNNDDWTAVSRDFEPYQGDGNVLASEAIKIIVRRLNGNSNTISGKVQVKDIKLIDLGPTE